MRRIASSKRTVAAATAASFSSARAGAEIATRHANPATERAKRRGRITCHQVVRDRGVPLIVGGGDGAGRGRGLGTFARVRDPDVGGGSSSPALDAVASAASTGSGGAVAVARAAEAGGLGACVSLGSVRVLTTP